MNSQLSQIRPPIDRLALDLTKLNNELLKSAVQLCKDIAQFCEDLRAALGFCELFRPIPFIGQLVSQLAKAIEGLRIPQTVEDVVNDIRSSLEKARNETIGKITKATNSISNRLQQVSEKFPNLQQALEIMLNIFSVVDLGIFVFYEKNTKDPVISDSLVFLDQITGKLDVSFCNVSGSLVPVKALMNNEAVKESEEVITTMLREGLGDVLNKVNDLKGTISPLLASLQAVKIGPKPITDLINAIFRPLDEMLKKAVDNLLDETGLRRWIHEFVEKLRSGLGVDELQHRLSEKLGFAIGALQPFEDVVKQTENITANLNAFEVELNDFQRHPAGKMFTVVHNGQSTPSLKNRKLTLRTGLKAKYPQIFQIKLDQLFSPPQKVSKRVLSRAIESAITELPNAGGQFDAGPADIENVPGLKLVERRLRLMDDFVDGEKESSVSDTAAVRADQPLEQLDLSAPDEAAGNVELTPLATDQAVIEASVLSFPSLPDPIFTYALYQGQSVSVLMRTVQASVVELQAGSRTDSLAPMSSPLVMRLARRAVDSSDAGAALTPSGGKALKLDEFVAKSANLTVAVTKVKTYVGRINTAAQQADADFAEFAPESIDFGGQLVHLVQQLDPLFASSSSLIELPLKYRTAFTESLSGMFKEAGILSTAIDVIPSLFNTLEKAETIIKGVHEHIGELTEQGKTMTTKYKDAFKIAKDICTLGNVKASELGYAPITLSTLTAALQIRLDAASTSLKTLAALGTTLAHDPANLAAQSDVLTKLEAQYGRLLPVVDLMLNTANTLPPLVDSFYDVLSLAHADVQKFFTATKTVADLCRSAEQHVVSAHVLRDFFGRVDNAIQPFEGILAQLQVRPDAVHKGARRAADAKPSGPSAATPLPAGPPASVVLKIANEALADVPKDMLINVLESVLIFAVGAFVDNFVRLGDLEASLLQLSSTLSTFDTARVNSLIDALKNLIHAIEPTSIGLQKIELPHLDGQPTSAPAAFGNPLLDEASATELAKTTKEISDIVAQLSLTA
ncbi:MAG: hypothetical protein Q9165_008085 [Trypethelium subeluteriae]